MRGLSLPHEHGGLLTLLGGTTAAALLAPQPLTAVGIGAIFAAGFCARDPIVKQAAWDDAALIVLLLLGGIGAAFAPAPFAIGAALASAGMVGAYLTARACRRHRDPAFEAVGMAALGAGAAVAALAGGVPLAPALLLGFVLAVHAMVAVPLVRSELRTRGRAGATRANRLAAVVLAVGALAVTVAGQPLVALAFLPRAAHVAVRYVRGSRRRLPSAVGARETVLLALALTLVAALVA